MGIETNSSTRIETKKSEVERGEKDMQEELSAINARLDSMPEEESRRHSADHFGEIITTLRKDQGLDVAAPAERTPEETKSFKEYKSLLEQKGNLVEERDAFYEKNPDALKLRLKEIYKSNLRDQLNANPELKDEFMLGREMAPGTGYRHPFIATDWFVRPQENSKDIREYNALEKIQNKLEDEREYDGESNAAFSDFVFTQAAQELHDELAAKDKQQTAPVSTQNFQERVSPQTAEFMTNHILDKDLAYQDAELPEEQKEQMLNWSRSSESAKKYAESIANAANRGGLETVRNTARQMRDTMISEATRLGIPVSPHGKSTSWAMWDTGKQYHFFTHQDENQQGYDIGNPLESESKREEIINRQLGWEAYAAFQNNPEYRTSVTGNPENTDALELFNKAPKVTNGTLSSRDLAELGKKLRTR